MKKLLPSLVAVKKITSTVPRSQYSEKELEHAAKLTLEAGGLINPLVLKRTSLQSYEVVDGDFEYYVAVRAREINPIKGETIAGFILEPENEKVLLEQLKALRKQEITEKKRGDRTQKSTKAKPAPETDKPVGETQNKAEITEIEKRMERMLQPLSAQINQLFVQVTTRAENPLEERLAKVETRIDELSSTVEKLGGKSDEEVNNQFNLMTATPQEIGEALTKAGANEQQKRAALKALNYWKSAGRQLTWSNLEKSTQKGAEKINYFAEKTYNKLQEIGYIPDR